MRDLVSHSPNLASRPPTKEEEPMSGQVHWATTPSVNVDDGQDSKCDVKDVLDRLQGRASGRM